MKTLLLFLLAGATASAVGVRIHNGTTESVTVEGVAIAAGAVESVPLPGTVLVHSRTTAGGLFESWATDVSEQALVSLQPGGRILVSQDSPVAAEVFLHGFFIGCAWELLGLILRIVRKVVNQTTSV